MALWVLMSCVLSLLVFQVCCSAEHQHNEAGQDPKTLYLWRNQGKGMKRVKRDWIIPPIRVSENSRYVPENLVQIKSDKIFSGVVIYKLEGPGVDQEPKDLFEIDDKTGIIRSKKPLDRERYSSFTLKAFALSPSGERLENPTTIEIVVLDQNDNKPAFTLKEFFGSVPEFSLPGTSVMSVTATDADDPMTENAALSFSIVGQESIPPNAVNKTMFGINYQTGTIYTKDVGLDREVVKKFKLKLEVADMGGEGLRGEAVAIITISDINNHAPQFHQALYSIRAQENVFNVEIGRVSVTDRDEPGTGNWEAKYSILSDPNKNFAIQTDPVSNEGILTVMKPLDFEVKREHKLILTVENINPLSSKTRNQPLSSATVMVTVENQNEAPYFKENPIRIEVPENEKPGKLLKSNIASDPDHSELRFEISKDPEGWLEIKRETGDIFLRGPFNMKSPHVKNNIYSAVIKVTDAGGVSASATVNIILEETNDFPPQLVPLSSSLCSGDNKASPGVLLTAVDEDHHPHAAPFIFYIADPLSLNWTVFDFNDTHAVLRPTVELEAGEYQVPMLVKDSGSPSQRTLTQVNVTVCLCDSYGDCRSESGAFLGSRVGVSFIALIIIIACSSLLLVLLLLAVALNACGRRHHIKKGSGLLVAESEDDVRDNILNYDEQGGGEEDENAFNIDLLWNPHDAPHNPWSFYPGSGIPRGKEPLRKDAPHNLPSPTYPRRPPADPTDIEDYINEGLEAADNDPNVPPYDTALIYDYEGEGSVAGSLSSIVSGSSDGDQDYDYLNDWGPRFQKLANMFDPR
ncbi:PREDICTED: cadherin-15 [Cyprinodon variegatus]|uniref:Cadherin 15, type 1, M-cadherin (myotubule) n=1 Tax=Cyprinodon variegatus TaxID=28743 RepID=A0A3Q2GL07_CYPVA|nr:PREDICTED: cadherin-15 [Cyprinodon variegatus]